MTQIGRVKSALRENGLDAIAFTPGPTLRYVTGHDFIGADRFFALIVPTEGEPVVVLPNFDIGIWSDEIHFESKAFGWDDVDGPHQAMADAAAALPPLKTLGVETLGTRYMEFDVLRRQLPDTEIKSGDAVSRALRLRKTAEEIEATRGAVEIMESALEEVLAMCKPGETERAISLTLSGHVLRRGGALLDFDPIVLGGPRAALPHGTASERPLQVGELLLFDYGTRFMGYHSDITRTFVVGAEPNEQTRNVYEAVLEANAAGRAAAKAGMTAHELHHATQQNLHVAEFEDHLKHRTGHGLGLDIHEPPSVMDGNHEVLEAGSIITIEPGLYLEGWGGVRIEDDVLITENGAESLSTFPRELRVVGA